MSWSRCLPLLLAVGNGWAAGEHMIGGGAEADSADGMAAVLFAGKAVGDETWLSGGFARTTIDPELRDSLRTWYADVAIDHYFDPVGIRLGASYWGDNDLLDSVDARISGYVRASRGVLGFDYEYRDFELELPATDFFPSRKFRFDANGIGFSGRLDLNETVDLHAGGIVYDYSVDLSLAGRRDIANFLSASRLSLINSLVDYRARIGLGIDVGLKHLSFDVARWKSAVAGSVTNSYSTRFMAPISAASDIEFGVGYDDSESYGEVLVFSVYVYFYGGT